MFDRNRPYEPLTSDNAALILVDHQVGLMTGVRDMSPGELKHNVVGLAKAAKALKLPIVVTTTARDSMWGPTFPELVEALPGAQIIDRGSVNAFDGARTAHAIEATGRLVYEAVQALGQPLSKRAASCLFSAVATDTGWFRHKNTLPATLPNSVSVAPGQQTVAVMPVPRSS